MRSVAVPQLVRRRPDGLGIRSRGGLFHLGLPLVQGGTDNQVLVARGDPPQILQGLDGLQSALLVKQNETIELALLVREPQPEGDGEQLETQQPAAEDRSHSVRCVVTSSRWATVLAARAHVDACPDLASNPCAF